MRARSAMFLADKKYAEIICLFMLRTKRHFVILMGRIEKTNGFRTCFTLISYLPSNTTITALLLVIQGVNYFYFV